MKIEMLLSKIRFATVTRSNAEYRGSLTLDKEYMKAAGMYPWQKVDVNCKTNGVRATTYLLEGEPGSGKVEVNGALAHLIPEGSVIHINAYGLVDEFEALTHVPVIVERVN